MSSRLSRFHILTIAAIIIVFITFQLLPRLGDDILPESLTKFKSGNKQRLAYATFLGGEGVPEGNDPHNFEDDKYFVATRVLAYQLLHAPETRTTHNIPLIVLVTPAVTDKKRARLRKDGATVIEAKPIEEGTWVNTGWLQWRSVVSKLRIFELTQFDLVCFVDGDTILTKNIDGVFNDTAASVQMTYNNPKEVKYDESPLPQSYVFAGVREGRRPHKYPPSGPEDYIEGYLNAGFFIVKPSLEIMEYYKSLMRLPEEAGRFPPNMPEQNLLNYAHREDGNMPWEPLSVEWNIHYPTDEDLEGGVASLHEKWWEGEHDGIRRYMSVWKGRMAGYWEAKEGVKAASS